MTKKVPSTSFTKQNEKEKQSRYLNILKNDGVVVVWERGSKTKESFSVFDFDKKKSILTLRLSSRSEYAGKEVLYSFSLSGVSYFGQGNLSAIDKDGYKLDCNGDLFKRERRESYRLLTYPHHNVYVQIPVTPEELKKSTVIDLKTGMSQTGLFNNFLKIVGDQSQAEMKSGFMRFRVLDVSVTGLAFQITDLEKTYITDGKMVSPIFLVFNGEEIEIPRGEIRYIIPLLQKNGKAFKVGMKFKDMTTNLDEDLGRLINEALRDFDSEFEDFI